MIFWESIQGLSRSSVLQHLKERRKVECLPPVVIDRAVLEYSRDSESRVVELEPSDKTVVTSIRNWLGGRGIDFNAVKQMEREVGRERSGVQANNWKVIFTCVKGVSTGMEQGQEYQ